MDILQLCLESHSQRNTSAGLAYYSALYCLHLFKEQCAKGIEQLKKKKKGN